MKKLILTLVILTLMIPLGYAKVNIGSNTQSFNKPMVDDYLLIDVNTISAWVTNYGSIFRHPTTGNSGFEWPKDGGVFAIYAAGLWVGARVGTEARVAVAEYSYEYGPGQIDNATHLPLNPDDPDYIIYKLDRKADPTDVVFPQVARDMGAPDSILGDQMLWSVYNDGDPSYHVNMATGPLKVEVQQSVFAYDRLGPLGNTVFIKWKVVNKSGAELKDAYITVWSDPDLGDSGDDFVGCDTVLSLGYCYNSGNNDGEYGASPPAVGFDFLQGPIVPSAGDTALVSGQKIPDYRNLPMTSFIYYNNSNDNNGNPQTGGEVYNFMQGRWRDGTPITNDGGTGIGDGPVTKFMYPGDPEAGTGWLDSAPADRRFLMTTGPFTMQAFEDANGNGQADIGEAGVQEIVAGACVARGLDNKNSVTLLKFFDTFVQSTYDANFSIPEPPPTPQVEVTELSREVILNWDNDYNRENAETYHEYNKGLAKDASLDEDQKYYDFEGYIVYQYDFLDQTNVRTVATYDVTDGLGNIIDLEFDVSTGQFIPVLRIVGNDKGLQRFLAISEDKFSTSSDPGLINGTRYWFGVASYGYNEFSVPKVIESSPRLLEVSPQAPSIGTQYYADANQMITSVKSGASDGGAFGIVVDPSKLSGDEYKIDFFFDPDNNILWKVTDVDRTTTVLDSQSYQSTDSTDTSYPVADGIQWKVLGPLPGINTSIPGPFGDLQPYNGWDFQGTRWVSWADHGGSSFGGSLFNGVDFFGESTIGPSDYVDVELRWAGADAATEPDRWSKGAEYRRDLGYAFGGIGDIPFTAWDIESDPPRQLNICFVEDANNGNANLIWDMGWDGSAFAADGGREYLFIMNSDYDEGVEYNDTNWGPTADCLYAFWPNDRGTSHPYLEGDWEMQIFASNVNAPGVTSYTFDTPDAPTVNDKTLAKDEVNRINVFPNPYYGTHRGERLPTEKWVEFTHLPPTCTIRIFSLAGTLVRTLERDAVNDQSWERWDLLNESELPVASGLYIYHIDVPGVGEKIGKLAVFLPQERLDSF